MDKALSIALEVDLEFIIAIFGILIVAGVAVLTMPPKRRD